MGKLNDVAKQLAEIIRTAREQNPKVRAEDIGKIFLQSTERDFSVYPSEIPRDCKETMAVISIEYGGGPYISGGIHLDFDDALETIVQHAQGRCSSKTSSIIFLTEEWTPCHYQPWRDNFLRIAEAGIHLEIYLLDGGGNPVQLGL
jgi:hypothetical protein